MITINCPKCKKIFNVKDEFAGKTGKCHICKTSIQVPVPFIEPSVKKVSVSSESETRNNSQLKSYKNLNWLKFAAFGIGGILIGIAILQIYPKIVQQYSFYTQANQLKAEKEQLIQANEKLKQEKQDSHSKNTELSNQLSNTRQEKEQLETDVDRLNRENQKLFNQIENIKKENEKLSSQIYVLEREYASLEKSKSKEVSILKNKDRESQQNINALVDLAKLDDSIISKYRTALLGIQVALSANNFDQALIAAAIADRLKSDAENLEIKRNRILGR